MKVKSVAENCWDPEYLGSLTSATAQDVDPLNLINTFRAIRLGHLIVSAGLYLYISP